MVAGRKQFDESDNSPVAREAKNQMIRFPRSDGDASRRPTNLDRTPDRSGQVNYHRKVHLNEKPAAGWREKVGTELAKKLDSYDTSKTWYLEDWPEGYELFVHCKGPVDDYRTDLYLFGTFRSSRSHYSHLCFEGGPSKFRSANEFIPHAFWYE
jgi:hypothetical protein